MADEQRGRSSLFGFILGITGTGTIISAGMLTLVIVINWITRQESGNPSVSSELMIALCGLVFAMGIFVYLGSMNMWKLAVRGAGVNLGLGIVLISLAAGFYILLSDFVPADQPLWLFLMALYSLSGIAPTLSGIFGLVAHFSAQNTRQKTKPSSQ